MFDEFDYGDTLTITLINGESRTGIFCGTDDADETPTGKDYVSLDDGTFLWGVPFEDIESVERVA